MSLLQNNFQLTLDNVLGLGSALKDILDEWQKLNLVQEYKNIALSYTR